MGIISKFSYCVNDSAIKTSKRDKIMLDTSNGFVDACKNIIAKPGAIQFNNTVYTSAFSPDGSLLVLGGKFDGFARVYSSDGSKISYKDDIYANTDKIALDGIVETAVFSQNGSLLVLGGQFSGHAKVYSVTGSTITFLSDIYADTSSTPLSREVKTAAFSPNNTFLVLGGLFTGYAKIYLVSNSSISFMEDIFSNENPTFISDSVNTAIFTADGRTLFLGGDFSGFAKAYSVEENIVTYIHDIYADAETTMLNGAVNTATLSQSGNMLVLGGEFSGHAKIYSLSGSSATYIDDIYSDAGETPLNDAVQDATFYLNGSAATLGETLILGGKFDGFAKVYFLNSIVVSYVSDIYNNVNATTLNGYTRTVVFSPNGNVLILGGDFDGFAKRYMCYQEMSQWVIFAICAAFYEQRDMAFYEIVAVTVKLQEPIGSGILEIMIATTIGIPDKELLSKVSDYFKTRWGIENNIVVLVPAIIKSVNVTVSVTPADEYGFVAVKTAVDGAIRGWFASNRLGKNVLRAELGKLIFGVEGVANYKLTAPAADMAMTTLQKSRLPRLGTLTITQLEGAA